MTGAAPVTGVSEDVVQTINGRLTPLRVLRMWSIRGHMRKLALTALIAAATLPLAACGGSISIGGKTLDNDQLQTQIGTELAKSAGVKTSTVSVACPDGQKVEKGHTFTCTLTDKSVGKDYTVKVTETNDSGKFDAVVVPQPGRTTTS
jgi:hypothetical protein